MAEKFRAFRAEIMTDLELVSAILMAGMLAGPDVDMTYPMLRSHEVVEFAKILLNTCRASQELPHAKVDNDYQD